MCGFFYERDHLETHTGSTLETVLKYQDKSTFLV